MDFESSLLQSIILALPDPVFVLSERGQYIEVIGGQDSTFYHDGKFLKGKFLCDVLPKKKAEWFLEQILKTLSLNRLRIVKYTLARDDVKGLELEHGPDGHLRFEGRIQPLPSLFETERAVVWVARNITKEYENEMKLRKLSETDELTGVFNRRKFFDDLGARFREFKRYGSSTALISYDLDYFKNVNDTFGHNVGDNALRQITSLCVSQLRDVDTLYRMGGEEFAVILPHTNGEDAYQIAERIRQTIEQFEIITEKGKLRVTISIGVSEFDCTDTNFEDLMIRADTALYEAKERGRNCAMYTSSNPLAAQNG